MRKIKYITLLSLTIMLSINSLFTTNIYGQINTKSRNCNECTIEKTDIVEESYNNLGNKITKYENGIEVEIVDEETFIIRDYYNVFDSQKEVTAPVGEEIKDWRKIGLAILLMVYKAQDFVLDTCQTIQYIFGHDICRIVLSYINLPNSSGTFKYELTGRYISGYIPGCQPSHSLACNSGYWEYKVTKV